MRRIGFGLDRNGFFAVLYDGAAAVCRLPSVVSCDLAMWQGIAWAEREGISADVVRVDVRLLRKAAHR